MDHPRSLAQRFWYKNAVIYAVDVDAFRDGDGDGRGDFRGLIERLDYLAELGVSCLWVLPFFRSPNRDNGYDIMDYYEVDPRVGDLDDFEEFLHAAGERGMRVILDLVVNHTSDQHPWFRAARRDPRSRFRDYYVWTESPPRVPPRRGNIFPGQEHGVWTYDEVARAYYYHRFYHFEPGLRLRNPDVREAIERVMDYWLSFEIAGFRVDAASHMIEQKGLASTRPDQPHAILRELRSYVERRRPTSVLIGEADVRGPELAHYIGEGDELNLLLNFLLDNYLMLALARGDAAPLALALERLPSLPDPGQWANFLRNLDELDLERLSASERDEVYRAFAPEEEMRIFGRGLRRRLAPMLDGDRRRLKVAFSLLFSLPGTPVIAYGDEIGMGDDLSLSGRNAVRTPMQWTDERNAGFSTAPAERLARPVISDGPFDYRRVNVEAQRDDPDSLLSWMKRLIRLRHECAEIGWGSWHVLRTDGSVFAHRCSWRDHMTVHAHNLADEPREVTLDLHGAADGRVVDLLGQGDCVPVGRDRYRITLAPYGCRWLRIVVE